MSSLRLFAVLIALSCIGTHSVMANKIPDKFLGTFKLGRSENFDEFLAAKGVNWFVRKMIQLASVTKVFGVSKDDPDAYDMSNLTSKKNTIYKNWKLGKMFEAEGLDGEMHKITFDFDEGADTLTEKHIRTTNPDDEGETYYYSMDGEELVLKMENNGITCKRFFKKESSL